MERRNGKNIRRAGHDKQPYGTPTSSHKSIVKMAAPSGTAANNLSPELSPGKDGGEPRAVRRGCFQFLTFGVL